jgi:hypothetical protein
LIFSKLFNLISYSGSYFFGGSFGIDFLTFGGGAPYFFMEYLFVKVIATFESRELLEDTSL